MHERVSDPFSSPVLSGSESRGDVSLLRTLYDRHGQSVYRAAYRITGSHDDAEDVLQEVFIGLPEALRGFEGRGSLEGWLHRIATRAALAKLRTQRRRAETPLHEALPEPAQRSDQSIDRAALQSALSRLPDRLRLVFVLREVDGYTHAEIAEILGIRPGTSEVRLHRAKDALRTLLRTP